MEATGSEVISTKVSVEAGKRLKTAAMRMGLKNRYTLLQVFIDCLLRFIDGWDSCPQNLLELFDIVVGNFANLSSTTGICKPQSKPLELDSAIIFVHEKGKNVSQQQAVMIRSSFMGEVDSTYNVQTMFDKFIKVALPAQYNALRKIADDNDMKSLTEAFSFLVSRERGDTEAEQSIRELFQDNERVFNKTSNIYDKKYVSHHRFDVDTAYINRHEQRQNIQQTNLFDQMEDS